MLANLMEHDYISLAHGNGGRFMRELIAEIFQKHLANPLLDLNQDAAFVPWTADNLVMTTDGFTVKPLEFPGGNIGELAVHGTCNDLAVAGAKPCYLTLNAFLEEGLPIAQLERIVEQLAQAAKANQIAVVAGDTKVVARGEGGGVYLATTGVGTRMSYQPLSLQAIQPGDKVLVSGSVGDHGIAVMLAREEFGLRGDLQSDCDSVLPLAQAIWSLSGLRFMRDPTRGGLATVAEEISQACGHHVYLSQSQIPVREVVQSVCDMLGYDPLYLACEGKIVAVVAPEQAETALTNWQALEQGKTAAIIGEIQTGKGGKGQVILQTALGGERLLESLEDDPLPRIC